MTLETLAEEALAPLEALLAQAIASVRTRVSDGGRLNAAAMEREQRAVHGLAWLATYVQALREMGAYARRLGAEGRFGEVETLLTRIGLGEYCAQIFGGIPMNQGEIVRLADFGLTEAAIAACRNGAVNALIETGNTPENRAALAGLIDRADNAATTGDPGLDETFEAIRAEMRRFADAEVIPYAQDWHRANSYIPMAVIEGLAGMGVFGLTIPEEYGGMGLGKVAMCVVSEELSRGYIGVGSLGTRSEIAAELILCGGTPEQKAGIPAEDRLRRNPPHRRLHRAQHRLGSREPAHPRDPRGRRLQDQRRQDLDHPSRARRPDDLAGAHQSERAGLQGPFDVPGAKAARHGRRALSRQGHVGRRDRGARLSRHEGI